MINDIPNTLFNLKYLLSTLITQNFCKSITLMIALGYYNFTISKLGSPLHGGIHRKIKKFLNLQAQKLKYYRLFWQFVIVSI